MLFVLVLFTPFAIPLYAAKGMERGLHVAKNSYFNILVCSLSMAKILFAVLVKGQWHYVDFHYLNI